MPLDSVMVKKAGYCEMDMKFSRPRRCDRSASAGKSGR